MLWPESSLSAHSPGPAIAPGAGRVLLGALIVVDITAHAGLSAAFSTATMACGREAGRGATSVRPDCDVSLYLSFGSVHWASAAWLARAGVCAIVGFTPPIAGYCGSISTRVPRSGCQRARHAGADRHVLELFCHGDVYSGSALDHQQRKGRERRAYHPRVGDNSGLLGCSPNWAHLPLTMFKITISWQDGTAIDKVLRLCRGQASSPYK